MAATEAPVEDIVATVFAVASPVDAAAWPEH